MSDAAGSEAILGTAPARGRELADVMVEMRDRVRLATDIYFPPDLDGAAPVLLERTPYDKRGTSHADRSRDHPVPLSRPEIARRFAAAGFIYVLQDCRGRYASEGSFTKYLNEGPDGVDTLAWLVAQPWCDGRVGTLGLSYGAHVQTALACFDPPGLAAMFIDSGGFSSAFHSGIRQGGAFELKQLTWALKHARLSPLTAADPLRKQDLDAVNIAEWVNVQPWTSGVSPLRSAPEYEAYVIEQWRKESFSDFWKQPSLYARGCYDRFADVPMVHMSSWFDPYALTATENYRGLADRKTGPVKLLMGPWTHGQRSVSYAGEVDFGPAAPLDGNIAPDHVELRRAWFERHLRGGEGSDYLPDPVTIFVMGGGSGQRNEDGRLDHGGRWLAAADWPLPSAVPTPFHFRADGSLTPEPAAGLESLSFRFDPSSPVPTVGGAIASGMPLMEAGAFDQREPEGRFGTMLPGRPLAEREDVLVFQTPPLVEDLQVIGPVEALLYVSSSAPDTDFTVKLVDLYPPSPSYPDGFAMNLSHGIMRLRFRRSFDAPEWLAAGEIARLRIQAFPTANLFKKGHRLRVEVSSSNFPHFDINPNSGAPAGEPSEPRIAVNSVHFSPEHRSHILLPIVG
jgi:putative CocE/NonD family hydrolase